MFVCFLGPSTFELVAAEERAGLVSLACTCTCTGGSSVRSLPWRRSCMDALLHVEARLILESPVRSRRGSTSSGRSLHASASESSLLAARVAASSTSTRNAAMPPSHHLFQQQQRMLMKRSKLPPSGNATDSLE